MKFSKFSELVNRILSNNHSHRRDMDVTIVIHSPGSIGSTPSVEVQSIHAGFDWDSGKVLIFPAQPLTTLTPEQITNITDSVRKGQSWHAYQEYKKHKEQLEKLSIELDTAKQRIAEYESNCGAMVAECQSKKAALEAILSHCPINHPDIDIACIANIAHNELGEAKSTTSKAYLVEIQAQGVEAFALTMRDTGDDPFFDSVASACADAADRFAAQLRKGGNQ